EDLLELAARYERLFSERGVAYAPHENRDARDADQQTDVEGKVARLRPVVPPPRAQPIAVRHHHEPEKQDGDRDADFHGADRRRRTISTVIHASESLSAGPAARGTPRASQTLPGEEPRFLHEQNVPGFLARDPGFVVLAVQSRLVERA